MVCVLYLNKDTKKEKNGKGKLRKTTKNMDFMTDFSSCYRSKLARPRHFSWGISVPNIEVLAIRIPSHHHLFLIQQPNKMTSIPVNQPCTLFSLAFAQDPLFFLIHFFLLKNY